MAPETAKKQFRPLQRRGNTETLDAKHRKICYKENSRYNPEISGSLELT